MLVFLYITKEDIICMEAEEAENVQTTELFISSTESTEDSIINIGDDDLTKSDTVTLTED